MKIQIYTNDEERVFKEDNIEQVVNVFANFCCLMNYQESPSCEDGDCSFRIDRSLGFWFSADLLSHGSIDLSFAVPELLFKFIPLSNRTYHLTEKSVDSGIAITIIDPFLRLKPKKLINWADKQKFLKEL